MVISIAPGSTSYWSEPAAELDPRLFEGLHLRAGVRRGVLEILLGYWRARYRDAETWSTVWIAGSGVSYQWTEARHPADLDCLVGVNYLAFRKANPNYVGLSDTEISHMLNADFRRDIMPRTKNWHGYELTFYVNPGATDIRSINPYAAYNLTTDDWTVPPNRELRAPDNPVFGVRAARDASKAAQLVEDYNKAAQAYHQGRTPGARVNAETMIKLASKRASQLFDEIHEGRHAAFRPGGEGYADWANYRWQAGKASGVIPALAGIKQVTVESVRAAQENLYGQALPDVETLVIRAALWGKR